MGTRGEVLTKHPRGTLRIFLLFPVVFLSLRPSFVISVLLSRIPSDFFATEGPHGRFDRSHRFVEVNSPAARLR